MIVYSKTAKESSTIPATGYATISEEKRDLIKDIISTKIALI